MAEIMGYICGNLQITEKRLNAVAKALRSQNKINKSVTLFMIVFTINMVTATMEQQAQSERIRKLEKEIEELKRPEGE